MTQEDEITKNLSLIEYYKEQLNNLELQSQFLQAAIADYQKAKMTIQELNNVNNNTDIFVPVGSGAFIDASIKDTSKILLDIGAGYVTEKPAEEAVKKIEERIERLQENQKKLMEIVQQVQEQAIELSNKTQQLMAESKQES
jgi:prefoldin alpha subunit